MFRINHRLLRAALYIILVLVLLFVYSRGFIPHDEGWILHPAQRILNGEVPYRDFQYIYTPGAAYLISFWYLVNGVDVFGARIFTMIFVLLTIKIIYDLSKSISKDKLVYILPIGIYTVWLPMHINFAWPVVFAIWSGLSACLNLFYAVKKRSNALYLIAGVMTGFTLLFKQNFGLAVAINSLVFFIINRTSVNKKNVFVHIAGIAVLPLIFIIYLYINNALGSFYDDMYFFIVEQFLVRGMQATPYIYPDEWYRMFIKGLIYLSPLIFGVIAAMLAFRKKRLIFHVATFCILFYILGIRPTTDKMHLVPLLSLSGLSLVIIYSLVKNYILKFGIILLQIILLLAGLYSSLFMNYYRWDTPLIHQNKVTPVAGLGVLTDSNYNKSLIDVTDHILFNTQRLDYIFVYSFSPSLYILGNRDNATRYIFMPHNIMTNEVQDEIIQELNRKKVNLIITDRDIENEGIRLTRFIKKYYNNIKMSGGFFVWQREIGRE